MLLFSEHLCKGLFLREIIYWRENVPRKKTNTIDNTLAEQFDKYMKRYPELYRSLAGVAKEYVPKKSKTPLILDIGAGTGLLLIQLYNVLPQARIIGIEPSEPTLTLAKKNMKKEGCKNCKLLPGQAEKLPLNNDSVDVVVSRFVLSSIEEPSKGFTEIYRVLKPGGRIILEALNREFPPFKLKLIKLHMLLKAAEKNVITYHAGCYKNAFSIDQTEQMLLEAGFTVLETDGKKNEWKFLIIAEKP